LCMILSQKLQDKIDEQPKVYKVCVRVQWNDFLEWQFWEHWSSYTTALVKCLPTVWRNRKFVEIWQKWRAWRSLECCYFCAVV
jgi:hypothetical protein